MRSKLTYHFINLLNLLRRILFLFLIVYITATQVVPIIFHQFDLKYEQCEIYEEDSKEKKMIIDDIFDEDQGFYFVQNLSSFYFYKGFTDFNPDIPLPPPKIKSLNPLSYLSSMQM